MTRDEAREQLRAELTRTAANQPVCPPSERCQRCDVLRAMGTP